MRVGVCVWVRACLVSWTQEGGRVDYSGPGVGNREEEGDGFDAGISDPSRSDEQWAEVYQKWEQRARRIEGLLLDTLVASSDEPQQSQDQSQDQSHHQRQHQNQNQHQHQHQHQHQSRPVQHQGHHIIDDDADLYAFTSTDQGQAQRGSLYSPGRGRGSSRGGRGGGAAMDQQHLYPYPTEDSDQQRHQYQHQCQHQYQRQQFCEESDRLGSVAGQYLGHSPEYGDNRALNGGTFAGASAELHRVGSATKRNRSLAAASGGKLHNRAFR